MIVSIVEFQREWVIVEYEKNGFIQRKYIPRAFVHTATKGEARISDVVVRAGLEYADVDLPAVLGAELPAIQTDVLQDQLRRSGVWTREDYKKKSRVVVGVVQRLRGADVATITSAVMTKREA